MAKTNMKILQTGKVLQWSDRANGQVIFAADMAKVTDPAMIEKLTAYGFKQAIADGAASEPTISGKRQKMQSRFDSIVNGTWGTRQAVVSMQHEVLFMALVKLSHTADNAAQREKFAKLPAAAIGKLYARPDVQKMLAEMGDGAVDEDFADLVADDEEITDEPADAETT